MPRSNEPLSFREAAFVAEYLIDGNGNRAAVAAGYAPKSARRTAYEMLLKPRIKQALQQAIEEQQKRTLIKADQVLLDSERIARKAEGAGEYAAALKGKELLGKHFKLFTEKHEHGGIGGGPVQLLMTEKEADL